MISAIWMRKRRDLWTRFEALIRRAHRSGVASLGHDELRDLALLYRQAATDLATVREDPSSASLSAYLNQLLGQAHNLLYSGARARRNSAWRFFAVDFPRLARETLPLSLGSAGLFAAFAVAAFVAARNDPGFVRACLSPQMREIIDHHQMWTQSLLGVQPAAASNIMTNNMSVSFLTFASGITAGLGTFYLVAFNGVLMGVVAAACADAGLSSSLWGFVVGHGTLELPAIFIAAAAGFTIARGMLFPGSRSRRSSLERAGGIAARLALGTVPILIVAGIVESFVSPSPAPTPLKIAIGLMLFSLLAAWIGLGGREDRGPNPAVVAVTGGSAPSPPDSR